jgi:hypothetical protein
VSAARKWEPTPDCPLCGQKMVWAFAEQPWQQDGYGCGCEDEPTEYSECSICGCSGPVGGDCDECHCEIGS